MKKLLLIILFTSMFLPIAHAEIKDYLYDGKEVYVHVKKDHLTTVIFPEPVVAVIRGFDADTYVIQRNDKKPDTLELMPTDSEIAEINVTGMSGEEYVLRFVANEDPYTKLTIRKMSTSVDKDQDKTIVAKVDVLPDTVIEKQDPIIQPKVTSVIKAVDDPDHDNKEASNLPPELNLKITLKGNDLPLKVYFSTISEVTHYNIITTPDIDSQKTSINLENIEVWRALKSLLYKFGYGFKVSQEDLIITETVVIGVILSAVLPALSGATNSSRTTSAIATVKALQTAATNYYNGNGGSYTGLSLATLASGNYLPANFTSGTSQNPWNGNITVAPDTNASYFDITFTNVPSAASTSLSSAVSKLSQTAPTYTATSQTWTAAF